MISPLTSNLYEGEVVPIPTLPELFGYICGPCVSHWLVNEPKLTIDPFCLKFPSKLRSPLTSNS